MAQSKLTPRDQDVIRRLNVAFCRNVPPQAVSSGLFEPTHDDTRYLASQRFGVPAGTYRVLGSDWLIVIRAGKLVRIERAQPPDFGGAGVVIVE